MPYVHVYSTVANPPLDNYAILPRLSTAEAPGYILRFLTESIQQPNRESQKNRNHVVLSKEPECPCHGRLAVRSLRRL